MMDQYCGISLNHFIMAGISKDGKLMTFSGPRENSNPLVLQRYIDVEGYTNWYNTGSMLASKDSSGHILSLGKNSNNQPKRNDMFANPRPPQHRARLRMRTATLAMETQDATK